LLLFWILLFDFQRLLFSIHNWDKFQDVSWIEWCLTVSYSIRLDLSTGGFLSVIPLFFIAVYLVKSFKLTRAVFLGIILIEALICSFIHAGEINAYPEWNHKLTSRVFTHLSNPDEVFRTADYSMTFWFVVYAILEFVFAWRIMHFLFKKKTILQTQKVVFRIPTALSSFLFLGGLCFLLARGGWQQIPINIDSAYFSKKHIANDLSINSTYYFGNSYLLYNRSEIDESIPKVDPKIAKSIVEDYYAYPREHDVQIFSNKRPNVVFVIMESWAAEAVGCLSETKGATPNFDALSKEGLLFTNMYSTSSTSEIGNSSIFSGNPAIPEISVSLQPEKHRKLRALNQDFQDWGYSSGYIFSGDLKYGNIGGYFMDHGFEDVKDESDFPFGLDRGKLNYYDEALYTLFLDRINKAKEPFLQCAFTGSTHSPYDHPTSSRQTWKGIEGAFMNSMVYADECLNDFVVSCKKQDWFENTIFIFVADHGHASPTAQSPHDNAFYRIPMLIWGAPLNDEFRGVKINKVGSQSDIATTLMNQLGGDVSSYKWSKDLLNPNVPEFALHTVIGGYGWVTPKGSMVYSMRSQKVVNSSFSAEEEEVETQKGNAFLHEIYQDYKAL
ncbi:MAG: LTA synthase family protein, partial [Emcibacteraceae bacterium]|nr:LTA synthase family protein [Emcibacteraceae bacterium]